MKPIIGILSCARERYMHQVLRDTWLKWPVDYRFFVGRGFKDPNLDVVVLNVEDDFEHLLDKVTAMGEWTLRHDWDRLFRVDNDTYVCVPRLLKALKDYEPYHVVNGYGGGGIWLDRWAMGKLIAADKTEWVQNGGGGYDDHFIAQRVALDHSDHRRYVGHGWHVGPTRFNETITFHRDQWNSLRFGQGQSDIVRKPDGGRMRIAHFFAKEITC